MQAKIAWIGGTVLALVCAAVQLDARRSAAQTTPAAGTPAAQGGPGGRGARGGGGRGTGGKGAPTTGFPAQQRPPGDASVIAHGKTLYEIHCRLCHGADLRGGEQGGSNLLRSAVALNDQSGELLQPVIREGRNNPGLPSMPAND